ncbi:MAG TPA: hypothetical protein VNT01_04055 [Symbiobacteriaceae bacterium]|nr:hypothetical protein [Symbiobacteriaceae bacterium]
MPEPRKEKHPAPLTPRAQYLEILDDLCGSSPGVAKRREMLLLIPDLMDKVAEGLIMDAVIHGKGVLNTITDVGSDSIAIVYNSGWALGFEGDGGELVILIDCIDKIQPRKTGLEIDLETGETVYLRFHGRTVE